MLRVRFFAYTASILATCVTLATAADEEPVAGLNALPEVDFSALSQSDRNPLGAEALAIHPQEWKHGEGDHFIYHFIHSYVATPISVEAEFHFRVIARELGMETAPGGSAKSHVYIFEKPADWKLFQTKARLEPWTGGIHSRGSLFILRDPTFRFGNNSLGHEIAHLVLARLFQRALPLWLEEGFAEYVSRVNRASYERARNHVARPRSESLSGDRLMPLSQLTALTDYPSPDLIDIFYAESERLVRFLVATDREGFRGFLEAMAEGEPFDIVLARHYAGRFPNVAAFEKEFYPYASKDARTPVLDP